VLIDALSRSAASVLPKVQKSNASAWRARKQKPDDGPAFFRVVQSRNGFLLKVSLPLFRRLSQREEAGLSFSSIFLHSLSASDSGHGRKDQLEVPLVASAADPATSECGTLDRRTRRINVRNGVNIT